MAISRVEIKDFLVFKGEFAADFCPGINVLIGGNGTGKTTLMKSLYMACNLAQNRKKLNPIMLKEKFDEVTRNGNKIKSIYQIVTIDSYFQYIESAKGMISGFVDEKGAIIPVDEPINLTFTYGDGVSTAIAIYGVIDFKSFVFVPTDDMLSHSKGFLALDKERELPFDKTYVDILSKAELPVTREVTPVASKIVDKVKGVIGGEVLYENDIFYIVNGNGEKTPFSLEASGFRKFGLLWKLLRNGLLESGSVLFWDEPENSLNPELIPALVDILLDLAKNGVQVFIATHDYNLARYFDVRKDKTTPVLYHNLFREKDGLATCKSSPDYIKLPNNHLERASAELFKAVVSDAMEVRDDE